MTKKAEPAKSLDTKDESAKKFVESGASAQDAVKDQDDAPSSEELRERQYAAKQLAAEDREAIAGKDGVSNHNSNTPVNPVSVDQADRPDYNPQRRPSSKANQMSSTAEGPREMAERVDEKKDRPTNAEITEDRRQRDAEIRGEALPGSTSPYLGEN